MTLIQLVNFMKATLNTPVYPLQFPVNSTDENIVVVDIINGDIKGSVRDINIQLMYKSKHPSTAEALANAHVDTLHNLTNKVQDGWQIILIQCASPNPFLNGQDENNNYIYTVDYRLLVSK